LTLGRVPNQAHVDRARRRFYNSFMQPLTYDAAGVKYDALDAFKRACLRAAEATVAAMPVHGVLEPEGARGESAYLFETDDAFLAHVEEGLGTKNLIADAMQELTGRCFYRNIGIDTVATIVNDMITCGALPISVAMHAAVGDTGWFDDARRAAELADGFAEGCRLSNAVWGGGETPALRDLVVPGAIVLAGSAVGRIRPKSLRIAGDVHDGDAIVLLASSGVHTNGLTLCRALAQRLPDGYRTALPSGRSFGEALLDPSVIYVRFVAACQDDGIPLRYAIHVTGHGWRKLMRLVEPFVYEIDRLPETPEVFQFLMTSGPIEPREAYATFNMGCGFAVIVRADDAERAVRTATAAGYRAWVGGRVRKQKDRKAVELRPLGITFESDTLQVR
jgi:phosphoribosylformylglycinamidine cyclo-ligase